MTGFGRGTARARETEVTVEVRSVNGRYAEATVRAPRALAEREAEIQRRTTDALERGKITVTVSVQQLSAEASLRVDPEAARAVTALLQALRDVTGLASPVTLDHVLRYPEVFTEAGNEINAADAWAAAENALADALDRIQAMRRDEGEALAADLAARLDTIEREVEAVEARAPARLQEARERLRQRVEEVLADERIAADRVEQEIVLLADKLDVTEETVRLRSHLAQFREALSADEPVGRRLNFLAQEIGREVNTIGSKANDPTIAHRAVAMKEELEKIREQVQNVV